jgi:hypothetical protein
MKEETKDTFLLLGIIVGSLLAMGLLVYVTKRLVGG